DGRFELGGLGSGLHSIFASASGHHNYIASRLSVEPGGDLGPISIELRPLAPGEEPRSEMTGIGIAIGANVDEIVIRGVFPGGGAADAGLRVGDAILAVDGQGVAQIGFVQSVQNIRGPEGTTVELLVRRASGGAPAPVMVVRKRING
ncbi:MAG TPA: PDZ domain-containing protein, partial [Polyangia bacterium]|nr:PDZ domain-containing protein [Polyangia bacterium]